MALIAKLKDNRPDWLGKIKKQTKSDFENKAKEELKKIGKKKMAEKTYVMTQAEKKQLEAGGGATNSSVVQKL